MTFCDYTPTVHFTVTWQNYEEKTKYRLFYEATVSVFEFLIKHMVLT